MLFCFCCSLQFDDGKVVYSGEYNGVDILPFVNAERLPLFIEFNDKVNITTSHALFSNYPCMCVFEMIR